MCPGYAREHSLPHKRCSLLLLIVPSPLHDTHGLSGYSKAGPANWGIGCLDNASILCSWAHTKLVLSELQCKDVTLTPRRSPAAAESFTWTGSEQGMQGPAPGCRQRTQQGALQAAAHAGQHAARCPAQARAQPLTHPPLHKTCSLICAISILCHVMGLMHNTKPKTAETC